MDAIFLKNEVVPHILFTNCEKPDTVIFHLCGQGELGTNLMDLVKPSLKALPSHLYNNADYNPIPNCHILVMQTDIDSWQGNTIQYAIKNMLYRLYPDIEQVIPYGLSLGAMGAASFAINFPAYTKAVGIASGKITNKDSNVEVFRNVPLYCVQNYKDEAGMGNSFKNICRILIEEGKEDIFFKLLGNGHDGWVYADDIDNSNNFVSWVNKDVNNPKPIDDFSEGYRAGLLAAKSLIDNLLYN